MIYLEVTQKAGFFSKLWPFGAKKPMTPEEADALQAKKVKEAAEAADLQVRKETAARKRKNYDIATGDVLREILAKRQEQSIAALEKKHTDETFKFPEGIIETMLQGDPELAKKEAISRSQAFGMLQNTAMERLAAMEKDDTSLDLSDADKKRDFMNAIWTQHKTSFRIPSPVVQKLGEAHGLLTRPQTAEEIRQDGQTRMDELNKLNRAADIEEFGLFGDRGSRRFLDPSIEEPNPHGRPPEAPDGAPDGAPDSSAPVPTRYRTVVAYHGVPMKDAATRGGIRGHFLKKVAGVKSVATVSPADWAGVEFHVEHYDDFEAGLKDPSHATGTHPEGHPLAHYPKGTDHPPYVYKQQPIYDDTEASASDTEASASDTEASASDTASPDKPEGTPA